MASNLDGNPRDVVDRKDQLAADQCCAVYVWTKACQDLGPRIQRIVRMHEIF